MQDTRELLKLVYDKPALEWEKQALPIGNGRLGAMLVGAFAETRLQFNVDSLWTGGENPSGEYSDAGFGNYQAFGDVYLDLEGLGSAREYRRELDLGQALYSVSFTGNDGSRYHQQAFASHPAELLVLRTRALDAHLLSGGVRLTGAHADTTVVEASEHLGNLRLPAHATGASSLAFSGSLDNGLEYAARLLVFSDGGTLRARGNALTFEGCRSLTLLLGAATNYSMDGTRGWRAASPTPAPADSFRTQASKSFERLLAEHQSDHESLFSRVSLDLGQTRGSSKERPLDERIRHYTSGSDPELITKLFQYGRYLLIASSRNNGVPANLQGLWNESNSPPWHSDYHTNINTQMNYWLAEPTNLAECHRPLFDLLDAMKPACRAATRAAFGPESKGFTYRTSHNIFGGQGWEWNTTASAWYSLHYYEHYVFSKDREFLRQRAWPYLSEVSEFWLGRLRENTDGKLVAPDGWSPEHGPREDGVSYDQQLIHELFANTLELARELGETGALVERIQSAKARLLGPAVGRFGQLQEWSVDRDDPHDRHRHTSHLVGVYPGRQISLRETPQLAEAARVSLEARGETGDSQRSWTWPWRCALWARLGSSKCHRMIDGLIEHNLLENLITTHPPLQLDGNFGITAGISEMLLQSHTSEISLLPGVDFERWPTGSFRGLRARGNFELAARWQTGVLREATLLAKSAGRVTLRSKPPLKLVLDSAQRRVHVDSAANGAPSFNAVEGESYSLRFEEPDSSGH